jgi:hypothetical protein
VDSCGVIKWLIVQRYVISWCTFYIEVHLRVMIDEGWRMMWKEMIESLAQCCLIKHKRPKQILL